MRKPTIVLMIISMMLIMISCGENNSVSVSVTASTNNVTSDSVSNTNSTTDENADSQKTLEEEGDAMPPAKLYTLSGNMVDKLSKFDQLEYYNEDTATRIVCTEGEISVSGNGADITGSRITLYEQGTYIIKGDFPDNSIYVNSSSENKVHIVLDGANIACNTTSPIYGAYADKIIITLAEDSVNSLSDTINHANDDGLGCLFSRTDVTINGKGTLNITGNYSSGIQVKKNFKVYESTINIEAENNGIKGNNSVTLVDSNITITAKGDGIKTSEIEDRTKGFIFVSGGIVEVTSDDDVFQATNALVIRDAADIRGRCYGSLVNCKEGYVEGIETIKTWE